jgi:hypothetical protein
MIRAGQRQWQGAHRCCDGPIKGRLDLRLCAVALAQLICSMGMHFEGHIESGNWIDMALLGFQELCV